MMQGVDKVYEKSASAAKSFESLLLKNCYLLMTDE